MKSATIFFLIVGLAVAGSVVHAQDAVSLEQMRQTAEQGNADAQLEMGILYEFGYKMPKNDITALAWYLRAAEQGNELAAKRSETLKSGMKPEDMEAAQRLSQELAAKKPQTVTTPAAPAEAMPASAAPVETTPAATAPVENAPMPPVQEKSATP